MTLERTPGLDNRVTLLPVDGEIIITDDDGMKTFLHESYVLFILIFTQWLWLVWKKPSSMFQRM